MAAPRVVHRLELRDRHGRPFTPPSYLLLSALAPDPAAERDVPTLRFRGGQQLRPGARVPRPRLEALVRYVVDWEGVYLTGPKDPAPFSRRNLMTTLLAAPWWRAQLRDAITAMVQDGSVASSDEGAANG